MKRRNLLRQAMPWRYPPPSCASVAFRALVTLLGAALPALDQVPFTHRIVDAGFHGDCKAAA